MNVHTILMSIPPFNKILLSGHNVLRSVSPKPLNYSTRYLLELMVFGKIRKIFWSFVLRNISILLLEKHMHISLRKLQISPTLKKRASLYLTQLPPHFFTGKKNYVLFHPTVPVTNR